MLINLSSNYPYTTKFKWVIKLIGYILTPVFLFSFTFSKLDLVCAVRIYVLGLCLSMNLIVFSQLHWLITGLIYSSVPIFYWWFLTDQIDKEQVGFTTEMYWVQLQVILYVVLLAYKVQSNFM